MTQDSPFAPGDPPATPDARAYPPSTSPGQAVVHFDTVDLRLSQGGVTLRRIAGGADDGWFLDLPRILDGDRSGVRRPLGNNPMAVPATLLALLRARLRGQPVGAVELVAGALVAKDDDSGPLHLSHLVTALVEIDPWVRLNHPAGVDQMRQVSQRLASCLVDVEPLFAASAGLKSSAGLASELDWLLRLLEAARDAQVVGERLAVELDRQPAELVSETVRRRIEREAKQQGRPAQIALVQALNSRRYLVLLDLLEEWAEQEPESVDPEDVVSKELTRRAARSHRRLLRAMKAAEHDRLDQGSSLDRRLTAVSRSRYTAEAASVVIGKPARQYAARAAKVQAMLQHQRDVMLLRSGLIALAGRAHRDPDTAFSYGRLHAGLERQDELDPGVSAGRWNALIERAERWPGC